jgi:hypothetical protein
MSEPAAFLGGVCQIFDSEDPLRSDTTLLVASLLTLGIPSAGRDLFHCTYENVRGAVQFNTVWTLRGESSCKRFGTPAMQKAWQDHPWLAANPAHPLAILRSGLTYARAMTYTPRFTLAELAAIERPETWLEAAFRNLIYLLRNIPSAIPQGIVRFGPRHMAFVRRNKSEAEKARFLRYVENPSKRHH